MNKLFRLLLTVNIILVNYIWGIAQTAEIDSLKIVLTKLGDDTNKVNTLNKIAGQLYKTDSEQALNYLNSSVQLSERLQWKKGLAYAYNYLGLTYCQIYDYEKGLMSYSKSVDIYKSMNDLKGTANIYNNIGNLYKNISDFPQALNFHLKSLKIRESINDKKGISKSLTNIGNVYFILKQYEKALDYINRSIKIKEEINDSESLISSYVSIANVKKEVGKYSEALEYELKCVSMLDKEGKESDLALILGNVGLTYEILKDYPKAIACFQKSMDIRTALDDKVGQGIMLSNIGNIYLKQGDFKQALKITQKAYSLLDNSDNLEYQQHVNLQLSELYDTLQNSENSYRHYKKYVLLKDSIVNEEKIEQMAQLQTRFEIEKEQSEIERQKKIEEQKKQAELDRIVFIQYLGISLGLVIVFIIVILLGKNYFSVKFVENAIVLLILLLFEFVLVVVDPMFQSYVGNTPLPILLLNVGLAILFTPVHSFIEYRLKAWMIKTNI